MFQGWELWWMGCSCVVVNSDQVILLFAFRILHPVESELRKALHSCRKLFQQLCSSIARRALRNSMHHGIWEASDLIGLCWNRNVSITNAFVYENILSLQTELQHVSCVSMCFSAWQAPSRNRHLQFFTPLLTSSIVCCVAAVCSTIRTGFSAGH